jgi:hypothetical protein
MNCKMLRNFNILAGMDITLFGRLWIHLIAWLCKGYLRQSFVMFSLGLSCFLGSYEIVHLCSVQFICIPV